MMKKKIWPLLVALQINYLCVAQSVGIGTNTPHASAALDVVSTNKGLSIPSMTTAQRNAISGPKAGLFIFDTNKQTLCMFNGTNWVFFQSSVDPGIVPPIEVEAADGDVGDEFGINVAIDGNYAVVGAHMDRIGLNIDQGSAYVFFYNGSNWVQQAKLTAPDGAASDNFGRSVSISGDYVVIGAENDDVGANSNQGSAYIFIRSGTSWTQQAKITASNGATSDNFGCSVSISGSYIAIGAKGDDIGANINEGSVYFFVRSGIVWMQQDNVVGPTGAANDNFGASVSISGDNAVIGAPLDDFNAHINNGTIHFFSRVGSNWSHDAQFDFDGTDNENFGASVSINGSRAIAGVPNWNNTFGGNARSYEKNAGIWTVDNAYGLFYRSISGLGSSPDDKFGYSVCINGNYVIAGAPNTDSTFSLRGAAHLFKTNGPTWFYLRPIFDPIGGFNFVLGWSVAMSGDNCIMGSPKANGSKGKVLFLNVE